MCCKCWRKRRGLRRESILDHPLCQTLGELKIQKSWWYLDRYLKKPENATLAFKQGSSGIPVFRRVWLESGATTAGSRVLGNPAGDQRLLRPIFWAVCQPAEDERMDLKYRVTKPHEKCRLCPGATAQELLPCDSVSLGFTGSALQLSRAVVHAHHIFM